MQWLTEIEIENFRCLRSVRVPLKPLTVLVGPNDSGKSAFLRALHLHALGSSQFPLSDHWRYRIENKIVIAGVPNTGGRWILNQSAPGWGGSVGIYQLPTSGALMQSSGTYDQSGPPSISSAGDNVPALVDYLLRRDRDRFKSFENAVAQLVPGLESVVVATPDPATRRLDLVIENGLMIPADTASAGVRLLLFFVALAYHPSPPVRILIEEPENGIHPKRLIEVVQLLREVSQGLHGAQGAQVVLTTHSPYLLDLLDLEKDQLLVFRRNDDGSRTAEPADPKRVRPFLDEFMLGEVWYNQGEPGLVAKTAQ